jgi:hypothetical protein
MAQDASMVSQPELLHQIHQALACLQSSDAALRGPANQWLNALVQEVDKIQWDTIFSVLSAPTEEGRYLFAILVGARIDKTWIARPSCIVCRSAEQ